MPTISGMRRRGYTSEALRNFCGRIGVSKTNGSTELSLLEYSVRDDLNRRALRVMAVLRPLKVVIDNYPEGQVEQMEAMNNPEDRPPARARCPFHASSTSSRTISAKIRPRSISACRPAVKCACAMAISSRAPVW